MTGKDLLPGRLMAWYPKAVIASSVMETLVAHKDGHMDERILKIVRMQASFAVACPFCVDMNSFQYEDYQISQEELCVLQGRESFENVSTFSERERLATQLAKLESQTPLQFPGAFIEDRERQFTEREIVILANSAGQVNYCARLIQALGLPPSVFFGSMFGRSRGQ